MRLNIG